MSRSRQGLSFELLRSKIHRVDAEIYCAKDNRTLFRKKYKDLPMLRGPSLKGGIPVVPLMGESSDIDLFSIEDYSATTRWILDLSSSK